MPSRKAVQQLRRKLEQQKRQGDALRRTTEELYLLVYRIHEDEDVSTYGIGITLGKSAKTVQGWLDKGRELAAEE
jgi:hypothetical protein